MWLMSTDNSTNAEENAKNTTTLALALRRFQKDVHDVAVSKGWWDWQKKFPNVATLMDRLNRVKDTHDLDRDGELLTELRRLMAPNVGEKIALIHSEASEALEAIRHNNPPDDKVNQFSGAEAELADVMIRIFDLAQKMNWDVIGAMIVKHEYNKGRAYMHGGKKF